MNQKYKKMYDSIHVDVKKKEELKKQMIEQLNQLSNDSNENVNLSKNKNSNVKFIQSKKTNIVVRGLAACAVAVLMLGVGTGVYTVNAEDSYITVDSQAQIGLSVNRWNKVICTEPLNSEGYDILERLDIKGIDYDEAVKRILACEKEKGYTISDENSLTISVNCNREEHANRMQESIAQKCEQYSYHKNHTEIKNGIYNTNGLENDNGRGIKDGIGDCNDFGNKNSIENPNNTDVNGNIENNHDSEHRDGTGNGAGEGKGLGKGNKNGSGAGKNLENNNNGNHE